MTLERTGNEIIEADKPKYLGLADVDGAFSPPGSISEVLPWTNLYICWAFVGYYKNPGESISAWLQRLAICVQRAARAGMKIYFGLDMYRTDSEIDHESGDYLHQVLSVLRTVREHVVAIDIADEPNWNRRHAKDMLAKVRAKMDELDLDEAHGRYIPIGYNLTSQQAAATGDHDLLTIPTRGDDGKLLGPEFVTLELFADPQNHGQAANLSIVQKNMQAILPRVPKDKKLWFWLQAFNRNGAFDSDADLGALVKQSYNYVKGTPDTEGFLGFNWARSGANGSLGARGLPHATEALKWISKDMGIS